LQEKYLLFEQAIAYVHKQKLKNLREWEKWSNGTLEGKNRRPNFIPSNPDVVYKYRGWESWTDWINKSVEYLSFEEARNYVRKLGLKTQEEWQRYYQGKIEGMQKPENIPWNPQIIYVEEWKGMDDWLGKNINGITNEKHKKIIVYNFEYLINEYKNNSTIIKILSFFTKDSSFKSIIELNLTSNDINEIEKIFFHFREKPRKLSQTKKAFVGLIFLTYVIYTLKPKLNYSSLWKAIVNDLERYSRITRHFLDLYFTSQNNPNLFLKESIELACKIFKLRNDFDNRDEHQYIRNTILLQIGLLNNSLEHLKLWLSNYNLPITISELLDADSENYSKEFHEGWRVLRRFRDNILVEQQAKNILSQNIWFKHLDLEKLLKVAKQRAKKQIMITQDEDLPIFYLEKISYSDDGLSFTINAQDLYSLNLGGYRYEVYIDDEYKGVLIVNNSKELILESPMVILNPQINQIDLEVRNEDNDVVYATGITLFDFTEQMILFDEDGNIYQNIFKKLNVHKKYHILMDSDLDCSFNNDLQREYFDGYATLIPFISYKDDCKVTYNNEILYELNFSEYIEKPEFIDQLVLYTKSDSSFILDKEYDFELRIMQIDFITEKIDLKKLPDEAKIIKWSYLGGYADSEDIKNNSTINTKLFPEMITSPKHTLLIKYKNRVFKKVVYCNFFERQNQYRLFQIGNDGVSKLVDKISYLTKYDLKKYKYYLSDFSKHEKFYLKNKSNFYQTISPNKTVKFTKFDGFGENIFISEHLFNSPLINIFIYRNSDEYISIKRNKLNEIRFHKDLPHQSKMILLDQNLKEYELSYQELQEKIKNNKICFESELVSILVIQGNSVIDSSYDENFLDNFNDYTNTNVVKNLLVSNYHFLPRQSYKTFLRKFITHNLEEFFSIFYNDRIIINENLLKLDFSKINILIEHVLFDTNIDEQVSKKILQKIIIEKQEKLLIDTPIVLFKLLSSCGSKKLVSYFHTLLRDAVLEDKRDESFTDMIVNNLFQITAIKGIDKHNLKIAMHYINGQFYLKKALEKLNG